MALAVIDAPFPLDPFTFVADTVRSVEVPSASTALAPTSDNFAIPAIPPHISSKVPCPAIPVIVEPSDANAPNEAKPNPNKKPPPPFNFPADRMPDFLRVIDGSTKTKPGLIDLLYETFSAQVSNLRKTGIERKLPEVAVKEKKVWKVKDEAWVSPLLCPNEYEALTCAVGGCRRLAFLIPGIEFLRTFYSHLTFVSTLSLCILV